MRGSRLIQIGFGLVLIGTALMLPLIPRADAGINFLIPLMIAGAGLGLLVSQLINYTLAPISEERVSEAAGVNSAAGSFGLSFGLAFAGAIMLAALSAEQLERFLARGGFDARTPNTITSAERLRREIAEVRRTGIAFDDGEFDPELRCIALPVRDFTGQVIGALGISGPVWRLSMETLQKRGRVVRAAADRLSAEFGYAGGGEPRVKASA